MEKLTATTKGLIFGKIKRAKAKVKKLQNGLEECGEEFKQIHEIEIYLIEKEIELLKPYLFTQKKLKKQLFTK